jgi:hypothetical protein
VFNPADKSVQNCVEALIIVQMDCAGAAGLHTDCESQWLRIGVGIERKTLRSTVVGKRKVTGRQIENDGSLPGLYKRRHQDQTRSNTQRQLIGFGLLSASLHSGKEKQ